MTTVHIYVPETTSVYVHVERCPVCKSDQEFLVKTYEWYGPHKTCLGCGDSWDEGELELRPFERGWRKRAVAAARAEAEKYRGISQ